MSLPRSSCSLRKWSSIPCPHILFAKPSALSYVRPNDHPPRRQHQRAPNNEARNFHSTTPCAKKAPARSPAASRSQDVSRRGKPVSSHTTQPNTPAQGDLPAQLKALDKNGPRMMRELLRDGVLDSITEQSFMHIAKGLLESAFNHPPSASAIQTLSAENNADPNLIFKIGYVTSAANPRFREWILSSCTLAGARIPLFITANRYINRADSSGSSGSGIGGSVSSDPRSGPVLAQIETLAKQAERDPRAMLIHAKVLGLQGEYTEALALTEDLMRMIEPSKLPPALEDNLGIWKIEPPWQVYLWLKRAQQNANKNNKGRDASKEKDQEKGKETEEEIIRVAAVEYQDPTALLRYADLMMQRGDLTMYEECMGKAATAGNPDACRKLGNFYYLTFLRRYPRLLKNGKQVPAEPDTPPGTNTGNPQATSNFFTRLSAVFGPRPLPEYRALALEWYRLGLAHGCPKAGIILSILFREDGVDDSTLDKVIPLVTGSREMLSLVQHMRVHWEDKESRFEVPEKLLDV
ncbi:hypothetical protein P175DRAFT_0497331 [Aspergillus ochraceoroseus IBT 24754]|uniref:Uncharacterized protein n=1 Tax=Aspergillus ochraceoroseus IBT 24754 TaxID=1392256 RepID=A0A2T5M6S2_9EURO|nr:uncharacterized protein P175DRAFT_0497331 [Aspergillus ochraceoroseus IBT 24754]PTU24224.1 hypothetical protein P175DRAFT_0497331 [Aspergillus ochraceoroseus IBT 24754]